MDQILGIVINQMEHLVANNPPPFRVMANEYVPFVIAILAVSYYLEMILITADDDPALAGLLSLMIMSAAAYYWNKFYMRPVIVMLIHDFIPHFHLLQHMRNLKMLYYTSQVAVFIFNLILLVALKRSFTDKLIGAKQLASFEVYIFMFWILHRKAAVR